MSKGELQRRLPWVLLGVAMFVSGLLLLSLTSGITFVTDEWDLLLLRQSWVPGSFLDPFNEHMVMVPAAIYKVLQAIFGMGSPRPMQVTSILLFLTSCLLLFVWLRSRVGDWVALLMTILIVFLGAAFEDLVWSFQMGVFGSVAAGLGALVALDRDDRKGDYWATGLLVLSLAFGSAGIPFLAGAAAEWALNPRERRRRLLVPAVPVLFFVVWWLGWGHTADSSFSLAKIVDIPRYTFEAGGAGMTSIAGLATGDGSEPDQPNLIWGELMLIALFGFGVWRIRRNGLSKGLLVAGAIAVSYFALAAMNVNETRLPTSSRFQLTSALFLMLVFAELFKGIKPKVPALLATSFLCLLAVLGGVDLMRNEVETRWDPASNYTRASLTAVETADGAVMPDYQLNLGFYRQVPIDDYRKAEGRFGSPSFTETELMQMDPYVRSSADSTLITAIGIELSGLAPAPSQGKCETRPVPADSPQQFSTSPVPLTIFNPGSEELPVSLVRFGDPPGATLGSVLPGSRAWLSLPPDGSNRPWQVTLAGDGRIRSCE